MTIQRWQQVKEIFHASLEREPAERPAFLAEVCTGDESLRSEVESLIAAHEREGSFIDSPAYEVAAGWLAEAWGEESPVGQQVGHYKILAELGVGGMGEVYLAQDTTLGRRIALKLLPNSFTDDMDRLRRFQQEARTASALNHPNILTIYEIGEQGGRHFIATELIEGQTLRQRLAGGSLPLDEALDIALQAASALAAAHEAGIVHRDIKPENIMLRRDGYVKVLDFGLAKLAGRKSVGSDPEAPTQMRGHTSPGVVMGTAHYMSPEQARGLDMDSRTDIWSLGCVLYEMLQGHAAFEGTTSADVTVSILEREPASLSALAGEIPAELEWMVKKALRKDRDERYQTVREMLTDLRGVKQDLEFEAKLERAAAPDKNSGDSASAAAAKRSGGTASATTNESAIIQTSEIRAAQPQRFEGRANQPSRLRTPLIAAAAVLTLAVAGVTFYKFFLQRKGVAYFQATNITRLTNHGKAIHTAISPDGKYFVYVLSDAGNQSLWLRQISAANDTQIVPPAPVGYFGVTFSHDGTDLYYVIKANDPGTLYRVPVLGGTPVKILEKLESAVSLSPDGKQFTFLRGDYPDRGESGIFIANADGSNIRQLATRKLPELFYPIAFTGPSWSPDGRLIACAVTNNKSEGRVIAVSVREGTEQVLTTQTWPVLNRVEWLPDMSGLLMIAREPSSTVAQIWHLSYPDGETRKVTNDLSSYRGLSLTADASKLMTVQTSGLINMWIVTGGDTDRAVQLPSSGQPHSGAMVNSTQLSTGNIGFVGGNESISWTPEDKIVFTIATGKSGDIWIMNADGSNRKQLTLTAGDNHNPTVSPDGRYIVFTSDRAGGTRNVWRMNIDGSNPKQLTSGLADFLPVVSPDNEWVVYSTINNGRATLSKVPIDGGTPVEIIKRDSIHPAISPDGKQLAYLFTEAADTGGPPNRIAVIPFEGGEAVKTFEIPTGLAGARTILHWSRDGRSLLYTVILNNVSNIWSQPIKGGKPVQLTNFKEHIITAYDWSRDGQKLAVSRGILIRDAVLISNSRP